MIAVVFGAVNRPTPMPFMSSSTANTGNAKLAGSSMSSPKLSAVTIAPMVPNRRAP